MPAHNGARPISLTQEMSVLLLRPMAKGHVTCVALSKSLQPNSYAVVRAARPAPTVRIVASAVTRQVRSQVQLYHAELT